MQTVCFCVLKCHLCGACTHGWRKTWMIKFVSFHLPNPAEWWWILFADGLRVLNKIRPGMYVYDTMACSTRKHVCVFDWPMRLAGRNAAPQTHGWAAVLETPVPPHALNAHICIHACTCTHTGTSMQSALEGCPYVGVNGKIFHAPCPRTHTDNGPGREPFSGVFGSGSSGWENP